MINLDQISSSLDLAQKSLDYYNSQWDTKEAKRKLNKACQKWKGKAGYLPDDFISKDSEDFELMMESVSPKYEKVQRAKQIEYNAKRRFERACANLSAYSMAQN